MNFKEFLKKYATPENAYEMREDLFYALGCPFHNTVIDILSSIEGSELVIDSKNNGNSQIRWGVSGNTHNGFIVNYWYDTGILESDWQYLMKLIAEQAFKSLKQ